MTKSFDFVINRRIELHIQPDLQSWQDWAFNNKIDPTFITFATQNPNVVFSAEIPKEQGPWCTPRSLVMLASTLKQMGGNGPIPVDDLAMEIASGAIGVGPAAQLMATIKLGLEMPKYEDIVSKPDSTKVPKQPDAQMLVCFHLAARVNDKDAGPIMEYISRMPKEFSIIFVKTCVKRNHDLIKHKAINAYIKENSQNMTSIM